MHLKDFNVYRTETGIPSFTVRAEKAIELPNNSIQFQIGTEIVAHFPAGTAFAQKLLVNQPVPVPPHAEEAFVLLDDVEL